MSETAQMRASAPTRTPFWEDIVDIFIAPRSTFERRRDGSFVPALVTLTLAVVVLVVPMQIAMSDAIAATMRESIAASGAEISIE